ncbi:MAG: hypothetical protein KC877_02430 [Candidatus Kaiserbacteria bacterium]|nr:hypothetical protein [Candidatus Kaiserbacteria bacterium]MCB9816460.1 hypothetical protein [Candidatus Nomurabacteria bacterium]
MIEEVTRRNALDVNVSEIALDTRFGSLVFDNADKKLSRVQSWLKEAQALATADTLIQEDLNYLKITLKRLAEHLQWLVQFRLEDVSNARQESDLFNQRVDDFYNDAHKEIAMRILPYLREEIRRTNPDEKKLDEEIQKVVEIRKELESGLSLIKEETSKIRSGNKEVGEEMGKRAAVSMASHFQAEAAKYSIQSNRWLVTVVVGYILVIGGLIWTGYEAYTSVNEFIQQQETIVSNQARIGFSLSATSADAVADNLSNIDEVHAVSSTVMWTALISKLVIIAALWFGLSFIIKNYNVSSHLSSINRHRAAIARTLDDFIAYEQQQEGSNTAKVLQNATDAMFKNISIGYVSKIEKDNSNPVLQIFNDLMGIRNQ